MDGMYFSFPPLLFHSMSGLMDINYITSAQLTAGFLAAAPAVVGAHVRAPIRAYVSGLVCQDQRQAPRVCEVFPSCISPCLGSPRPLIIPTLALISLPLSPPRTRSGFSSSSFCPRSSLSLSVISLFMFDLFAVLHRLMTVQGEQVCCISRLLPRRNKLEVRRHRRPTFHRRRSR